MLRALLLALVTALLVARPLVLGEDPGMTNPLTGASSFVLSLLWFVAGLLWAVWRLWSRKGEWFGGAVEAALAVFVVLVFVTAGWGAQYQHAAMLIAWEWVVMLLACSIVRQIARSPRESQCLLAILLASAVSLSVYSIYQAAVDLPNNRELLKDETRLARVAAEQNMPLDPDGKYLEILKQRIEMDHVFATFAHPNAFAGFLALLFPALIGLVFAAKRNGAHRAVLWLGGIAIATVGGALWLTHSRGAILGLLIAGGALALLQMKERWWPYRRRMLAGSLAIIGLLVGTAFTTKGRAAVEKATESFGKRADYWLATWRMIGDHSWLGVGPGNFGRHYPQYMLPSAYEQVQDPHNFLLEIAAGSGVFTLLVFLVLLGLFFRQGLKLVYGPGSLSMEHADEGFVEPARRESWPFYSGGAAGLVLAFLLRAGDTSAGGVDIGFELKLFLGVAVVGGVAFWLCQRHAWTGTSRTVALLAGLAALLFNFLVSGGISQPSVAVPFWVVAGLVLGSGDRQPQHVTKPWLEWFAPLPLMLLLTAAYLFLGFLPVFLADSSISDARNGIQELRKSVRGPQEHIRTRILQPLEDASREDPGNSATLLDMTNWNMELARLNPESERYRRKALQHLSRAKLLDPVNKDVYRTEAGFHRVLAELRPAEKWDHLKTTALALQEVARLDPTEAANFFELFKAWEAVSDVEKARQTATKALELHRQSTFSLRQLTNPQLKQVEAFLAGPSRP